jgi:hypothetical protein
MPECVGERWRDVPVGSRLPAPAVGVRGGQVAKRQRSMPRALADPRAAQAAMRSGRANHQTTSASRLVHHQLHTKEGNRTSPIDKFVNDIKNQRLGQTRFIRRKCKLEEFNHDVDSITTDVHCDSMR